MDLVALDEDELRTIDGNAVAGVVVDVVPGNLDVMDAHGSDAGLGPGEFETVHLDEVSKHDDGGVLAGWRRDLGAAGDFRANGDVSAVG